MKAAVERLARDLEGFVLDLVLVSLCAVAAVGIGVGLGYALGLAFP